MLPAITFVVGSWRVVVSTYPLALGVAVLLSALLFVRRAPDPVWGLQAAAAIALAGFAGARGVYLMLHGGDGTVGTSGLASMGGIAGGLLATVLAARLAGYRAAVGLDVLAPAGLLGLGLGRVGCFLAGCCYGRPTTLPWGISVADRGGGPRHPLQLYDAAGDLLLAAVLARLPVRPAGRVTRLACLAYGCQRAALELLRDRAAAEAVLGGVFTLAQVGAVALALGALLASAVATRWRVE